MSTPATVAWWKYIAEKIGQSVPLTEPAQETLRAATAPRKEIVTAGARV
jgi:hypothetical protein